MSRAAFYTHFTDKEDCFLSASREGVRLMVSRIMTTRAVPAGTPDDEVLRVACHAFLAFMAGEPEFSKIFYVDMPAAGPRAWERLDAAQHRYAVLNQAWHERARTRHPEWPAVPYEAYLALAGATAELVRSRVRGGEADAIPARRTRSSRCTWRSWLAAGGRSPGSRICSNTSLRLGASGVVVKRSTARAPKSFRWKFFNGRADGT